MTNTLHSAIFAAAMHVAGKHDVRYYLNGMLIEPGVEGAVCVATDGHRLLVIRTNVPWSLGSIIVPRAACEHIAKIKGPVQFAREGEQVAAVSGHAKFGFAPIDGRFPDWRLVVSKPTELAPCGFNPAILEGVVKSAGIIRKAFGGKVTSLIPVVGHNTAAMFAVGGLRDQYVESATFIVMPMWDSVDPQVLDVSAIKA